MQYEINILRRAMIVAGLDEDHVSDVMDALFKFTVAVIKEKESYEADRIDKLLDSITRDLEDE